MSDFPEFYRNVLACVLFNLLVLDLLYFVLFRRLSRIIRESCEQVNAICKTFLSKEKGDVSD